jgi:hypothetical protein
MPASHPAIRAWPRRGARQGKAVIIEFWPQHYDHPQPGGWPISCGRALEAMSATKHSQLPSNQPASHQAGAQQPAGCTPGSQRARAKRDTALREVNVCLEAQYKMQGACYQACTENNKTSNQGNCHLKLVAFSFSLRARTVRARNALASVPSPLPGLGQRKKNKLQTAVSLLQADRQSGRQRPSILYARMSSRPRAE